MKAILFFIALLASSPLLAISDFETACGEIKRLRTWGNGSDTYGVWVEFESNPQNCEGGFYVPHLASNKELIFSMALAAKAANQRMCIQIRTLSESIANRCVVNYIMHE